MGRHGVDGEPAVRNFFAAFFAIAVLAGLYAPLGHLDTHQIALAAAFGGFGHRLLLQGVHARQPSDGDLIQFDSRTRIHAHGRMRFDLSPLSGEPFLCLFNIDCHKGTLSMAADADKGVFVMVWLIAGLIVFLGVHSVRAVAPAFRDRMIAERGEGPWKGIYSAVAVIGLVLLIWGYGQARPDAPFFYEPPFWMRHVVILLMWIAMILLVATYAPTGHIKARIKHPMITAVKVWAVAHLLANGDLATIVLCLAFLGWAVRVRIAEKRRGDPVFDKVTILGDIIAVVAGTAITLWFIYQLHAWLFGVSPL